MNMYMNLYSPRKERKVSKEFGITQDIFEVEFVLSFSLTIKDFEDGG